MPKKKTKNKTKNKAIWIVCNMCEDWWCTVHHLHVFECECEDLDRFILNRNLDPYSGKTINKEVEHGTRTMGS